MKRSRVLFVVVVFGLLLVGFAREQRVRTDPGELFRFTEPAQPTFDELQPPVGSEGLRGVVLDADGSPEPGVEVMLAPEEPGPGDASPLHWTTTDAEGAFAFEQLRPLVYRAIVYRPERRPESFRVVLPAPRAVTLRLADPAVGPLEALPSIERAELAGRVVVPAGHALAGGLSPEGYEILLMPRQDDPMLLTGATRRRATADAEGRFRFEDVVLADYRLALLPPWARSGSWPLLDEVELAADAIGTAEPVLRIRSGAVRGVLRDPRGRPIEGALVEARPADRPERIWPATATGADGAFRIDDLAPGLVLLEVRAGTASQKIEVEVQEGVSHLVELAPLEPRRAPSPEDGGGG